MKQYEEVVVPAKTEKRVTGATCDKCSSEVPLPSWADYSQREFKFRCEFLTGEVYPEGGTLEGWEIQDLCDNCISELRALLEQHGFKTKDLVVDL